MLCTVAAPLVVDGRSLDITCELAALGMPVWAYSMPSAGATGPVTLAGMLTLVWAEVLGLVTAIQAVAPGAAILACCGPGILDMRAATMSLGSVENTVMGALSVAIGHHLGLPVHNSGLASDAKHAGLQAGYEKGLKALSAALAGADTISGGFGALDSSSLFHLPMVAVDAEIVAVMRRIIAGAEISEQTVLLDVIERVGPGGDFLKERVTRERIRAGEHYYPSIASRLPYDQWVSEGRTEVDAAAERVEAILTRRQAEATEGGACRLPEAQRAALAEICGVGLESGTAEVSRA